MATVSADVQIRNRADARPDRTAQSSSCITISGDIIVPASVIVARDYCLPL
jgi:hypothetical protein